VGRPPQELMRGWGIELIHKASIPNCGLGIQATCYLDERGENGRCGGKGEKKAPTKSVEMGSESRGFKEDLKN
jgi:hypothetical protein